jgi:MFS family permease
VEACASQPQDYGHRTFCFVRFALAAVFPIDSQCPSFGGFEYGYQQGVLGQSLVMHRFVDNFPTVVSSSSATGWLTSVLQLGGILGSLSAGVIGEILSRKYTMFTACCYVILGSYLYCGATYHKPQLLYAGRFFTGLGVGTFSGVGYVVMLLLRYSTLILSTGLYTMPKYLLQSFADFWCLFINLRPS